MLDRLMHLIPRLTAEGATAIPARSLRDALHAQVGLRLPLFPATIAPSSPPKPGTRRVMRPSSRLPLPERCRR